MNFGGMSHSLKCYGGGGNLEYICIFTALYFEMLPRRNWIQYLLHRPGGCNTKYNVIPTTCLIQA